MDAVPVLIVDDCSNLRYIVRLILELEGYAVCEARDVHETLDYLRTSVQPLVVLLDWQMPGLSGLEVLQVLADSAPQARRHAYILYTAVNYPLELLTLVPAGFHISVLSKFSELDELLGAVKQMAEHIIRDR